MQKWVRRFALAKVSTDRLTKGVSVGRNGKIENSVGKIRKYRNGSYKKAVPACRGKCQPTG